MKHEYPYIDKMRMIAALLVICIHISPLIQLNTTADFILTKIIARIAVPFFFITTSYFLFRDGYPTIYKIKKTLIQLLKWYFISIVIYIPIMIYNDYFNDKNLILKIVKDVLIDGTIYHLWYFPAIITGLLLILVLKKFFNTKIVFLITLLLYLIGLSGDSYYYLFIQIPVIKDVLNFLFIFMDYTRNGLFFAPLFITIGILISEKNTVFKLQALILIFIVSFIIMGIEACIVHQLEYCKHDSMYILLPCVSYFLFRILIYFKGKRNSYFKDLSLYIYILHPLMIVIVRMIGKLSHNDLLVNGNFIQFICVTMFTLIISMFIERMIYDG